MKRMTADEIMAETHKNTEGVFKACQSHPERMLQLMQYGAQMQIAAQLAELNELLANITEPIPSGDGKRRLMTVTF